MSSNEYDIDLHTLSVLNKLLHVNFIALAIGPFLDPAYCLSIAFWLPLMRICSAIMAMGPGPYPLWLSIWASQGNKQEGINSYSAKKGSIARVMKLIHTTVFNTRIHILYKYSLHMFVRRVWKEERKTKSCVC